MARKLKNFSFETTTEEPIKRSQRYPWDKWLDGDVWELTEEKDIKTSVQSFRASAFYNAKIRGLKIQTVRRGNKLIIQAYKEKKTSKSRTK